MSVTCGRELSLVSLTSSEVSLGVVVKLTVEIFEFSSFYINKYKNKKIDRKEGKTTRL